MDALHHGSPDACGTMEGAVCEEDLAARGYAAAAAMEAMTMIDGVRVKSLTVIPDERGRLMEMLRADDEMFTGFGQVYMTTAYPGVVKAWHGHAKQWDHMTCVHGMMKVALHDGRDGSPTRGEINEFFMGEHRPILVRIPPGVYHGFKCISDYEAIVINCTTEVFDYEHPDEIRVDAHANDIPYDWARKDG